MSLPLTINGVTFDYPETGDTDWGSQATAWANAVTGGMLQKAGGLFQLTSFVDFGDTHGLVSVYFSSRSFNTTDTGVLRLAAIDAISWMNANGDNHLDLAISEDQLTFNGSNVAMAFSPIIDPTSSINVDASLGGVTYLAQTLTNAQTYVLPVPLQGLIFTIKDADGNASVNNITINPLTYPIDGVVSPLIINVNYGFRTFICTNSGWFIVGSS